MHTLVLVNLIIYRFEWVEQTGINIKQFIMKHSPFARRNSLSFASFDHLKGSLRCDLDSLAVRFGPAVYRRSQSINYCNENEWEVIKNC